MSTIKYIFIFMLLTCDVFSQDLEKIGKKDMVNINGGLNISSVLYDAHGIENRRQPFTYFVNGNISANFLGVSLPYTFNYSNNQINYSQPCNINSFNPTYKWAKGYAGVTNMNLSQYTMAGHIFSGAGIELNPNKLRFSAFYGRFKKATEFDFETNSDANMAYKRTGYGASVGYEDGPNSVKLIYFSAKDDPRSISFVPLNTNVTPMDNTVISLAGKTTLYKNINVEGEYALSGLTRNILSPKDVNSPPPNKIPLIYTPNGTSQFFSAYKGSIGYRLNLFGINFNYERVDPEYRTLGSYYFNNDLENFTLAPNLTLLQGKLNFSVNTGLQRNNLNNNKLNTTKRWVGSFSSTFAPNAKWNFSANYSNFSSFTKQRPQEDPFYKNSLDTLNFYQLSQSAMATVMYLFGDKSIKENIMLNGNYQGTGQNQGAINEPGIFGSNVNIKLPSKVINVSSGYNVMLVKSKTSIAAIVNCNNVILSNMNILYYGPNLNVSQSFYKNLMKVSIGSSYNQVFTNQIKTNQIFSHRLSFSYAPKITNPKIGKFSFSFSATYLQKIKTVTSSIGFNEFTGNVALSYSF